MDLTGLYDKALDRAGVIVAGVRNDQLDGSTPCSDWDVRALTNHLIGGIYGFAALAAGQDVDMNAEPPDFASMDRAAAWNEGAKTVRAAFRDALEAGRSFKLPMGDVPAPNALGISYIDVVVHAWDLAKATGQDTTIPDELAISTLEMLRGNVSPEMRRPNGPMAVFDPEIEVGPDASPTDKLVAFLGRQP